MNETREYWRWEIWSDTAHRRIKTRHLMTEADALAQDPTAVRVPGTLELRPAASAGDASSLATRTPGL